MPTAIRWQVLAHAVAVVANGHEVAVVHEPIDQRRRHDAVAEDLAPVLEALVRGEHVDACS